jgi:hypothetical protein
MPRYEVSGAIDVDIEVGVGFVEVIASDRTDGVIEVSPTKPGRCGDVSLAREATVSFEAGRLRTSVRGTHDTIDTAAFATGSNLSSAPLRPIAHPAARFAGRQRGKSTGNPIRRVRDMSDDRTPTPRREPIPAGVLLGMRCRDRNRHLPRCETTPPGLPAAQFYGYRPSVALLQQATA